MVLVVMMIETHRQATSENGVGLLLKALDEAEGPRLPFFFLGATARAEDGSLLAGRDGTGRRGGGGVSARLNWAGSAWGWCPSGRVRTGWDRRVWVRWRSPGGARSRSQSRSWP